MTLTSIPMKIMLTTAAVLMGMGIKKVSENINSSFVLLLVSIRSVILRKLV